MIMFSYFSPIYGVSSSVMTYFILVYLCRYSESSLSQFLRVDFPCTTLKEKKLNICTMSTKNYTNYTTECNINIVNC